LQLVSIDTIAIVYTQNLIWNGQILCSTLKIGFLPQQAGLDPAIQRQDRPLIGKIAPLNLLLDLFSSGRYH
jgi:hypothetical protein